MFDAIVNFPLSHPLALGDAPTWVFFIVAGVLGGWIVLRLMANEAQGIRARLLSDHNALLQRELKALRRRGRG